MSRLVVFGQYAEDPDRNKVKLHVAVELKDKWPYKDLQTDMERLQGFYCPKNYGTMHYWMAPRNETFRRLRFKCPFMYMYEIRTADDRLIFDDAHIDLDIPGIRFCYPMTYMAEALALRHRVDPTSDEALKFADRFDEFPSYKAMYKWLLDHPEVQVPVEEY